MNIRRHGLSAISLQRLAVSIAVGSILSAGSIAGTLPYKRPDSKRLPKCVTTWVASCLRLDMVPSAFTRVEKNRTYLFVSYGMKPTGGYSVRISRLDSSAGRQLTAHVEFTAPPEGVTATRQSTRPYDLVAFPDTGWNVTVMPEGSGRPPRVAGLAGVSEVRPIVCESRAIKIFSPAPKQTVEREFEVCGVALVFEGTVQMRLTTDGNREVCRTFTTAATALDWGYFRTTLAVPDSVPAGSRIGLELFTIDEERGGEMNLARMPLRLR